MRPRSCISQSELTANRQICRFFNTFPTTEFGFYFGTRSKQGSFPESHRLPFAERHVHSIDLLCLWPASVLIPRPRRAGPFSPRKNKFRRIPRRFYGVIEVLLTSRLQRVDANSSSRLLETPAPAPKPHHCWRSFQPDHRLERIADGVFTHIQRNLSLDFQPNPQPTPSPTPRSPQPNPQTHPQEIDPLYLFACHLSGSRRKSRAPPGSCWPPPRVRTAIPVPTPVPCSPVRTIWEDSGAGSGCATRRNRSVTTETDMNAPYGLDIVDNCTECTSTERRLLLRLLRFRAAVAESGQPQERSPRRRNPVCRRPEPRAACSFSARAR